MSPCPIAGKGLNGPQDRGRLRATREHPGVKEGVMTPLLRMAALVVAALTVSASAFAQSSLPLPSTDDVVPAGGSETLGTLPMGNLPLPAECPACITVDFNDLTPEQVVSPDRYQTLGLR